jgi:hypothetical protein
VEWFVEVRQRKVGQVDQFEVRVLASGGDVHDPARDLLSVAARAGAAENDADPCHLLLLSADPRCTLT